MIILNFSVLPPLCSPQFSVFLQISFYVLRVIIPNLDSPNLRIWTCFPKSTEEGERCQSRSDNCGGGYCRPRDAAIALTAALLRHAFAGHVVSPVERSILYYAWEYIENLDKT